jgi:hypothetical protein
MTTAISAAKARREILDIGYSPEGRKGWEQSKQFAGERQSGSTGTAPAPLKTFFYFN